MKYLKNSKQFIRKLAEGKAKNSHLAQHFMVVCYIVKIALQYNEKCSEISFSSNRKVAKIRTKKRTCKRSFSENSSSEETFTSNESTSGESITSMKVQGKNQLGQGIVTTSLEYQIFPYMSLKKRNKSLSLLYYLRKNKDIKWNKKGEILYKGKILPETNIIHLIKHAMQNDKSRPHGVKAFYRILAKANIPKKLISNKEGKHLMEKVLHEKKIEWRPPGRLNKR